MTEIKLRHHPIAKLLAPKRIWVDSDYEELRAMVKHHPHLVNVRVVDGQLPLQYAIKRRNIQAAEILLLAGADINGWMIEPFGQYAGGTIFHDGTCGEPSEFRSWVQLGCKFLPLIFDHLDFYHGFTPLHDAAQKGDLEAIRILLQAGSPECQK